jgi:hypothetical protein
MQTDRPVSGNLVEHWMGGVHRGFNRFLLIVLLLIVVAELRLFWLITAEVAENSERGLAAIVFAVFILPPVGFAGGVMAAWLIGRKAFRPVAWGSIFILVPLGAPPVNLLLVRVLSEWMAPMYRL